jgi:hypothetical protein
MMKSKLVKNFLLFSLAIVLVGAFQNCGFTLDPMAKIGLTKANGNGSGYDGKAYATYGTCSDLSEGGLKSLLREEEDGTLVQVRRDCMDLAKPIRLDREKVRVATTDASTMVFDDDIFDEVRETVAESKLTRLICWSEYKDSVTESAIFYAPGSLLPGESSVLSGYVKGTDGTDTGVMTPVIESKSSESGALFQCTQDDYVFSVQYRPSGTSTTNYSGVSSTDRSIQRKDSGKAECFSQDRPSRIFTRGDL